MDKTRLETTILKNLILSDEYSRKVLPFVKDEYFSEPDEQVVYKEVVSYFEKYNKSPTVEALLINLDNNTSLSDGVLKQSKSIVKDFTSSDTSASEWLVDETEKAGAPLITLPGASCRNCRYHLNKTPQRSLLPKRQHSSNPRQQHLDL